MKLNEQQLASLSSPKAVREYLENQKENITSIIKQNLAVGDIFKRENLQVEICSLCNTLFHSVIYEALTGYQNPHLGLKSGLSKFQEMYPVDAQIFMYYSSSMLPEMNMWVECPPVQFIMFNFYIHLVIITKGLPSFKSVSRAVRACS